MICTNLAKLSMASKGLGACGEGRGKGGLGFHCIGVVMRLIGAGGSCRELGKLKLLVEIGIDLEGHHEEGKSEEELWAKAACGRRCPGTVANDARSQFNPVCSSKGVILTALFNIYTCGAGRLTAT